MPGNSTSQSAAARVPAGELAPIYGIRLTLESVSFYGISPSPGNLSLLRKSIDHQYKQHYIVL